MSTALIVLVLFAWIPAGQGPEQKHFDLVMSKVSESQDFNGPVCGILAMDAATKSIDGRFDLYAALSSHYIGAGRRGSGIEDLQKLARRAGLSATPCFHANSYFLASLDCPALLNLRVRSDTACTHRSLGYLSRHESKFSSDL
jgi:hypothetical protein